MKIENIYTSIACNRTVQSADWSGKGLIIFAANNAIALMNPEFYGSCKILHTYVQHTKRVNTVKWITDNEFISGSDDSTAILWNIIENQEIPIYYKLKGHESGVNVVDAIYDQNNVITVATASTDSTIKLWNLNKQDNINEFVCSQTILLQSGFCFAIKMLLLPTTNQILLAYTADNSNICLLTEFKSSECNQRKFIKIHELIGHEDWVRSLDVLYCDGDEVLLASGSQDTFVRIWKITKFDENNEKHDVNDKISDDDVDEIHVEDTILEISLIDNNELCRFSINLETVLQGHEGWVYGVHWSKNLKNPELLSSSIDKTLIIWTPNKEDGIWMEKVRLGDVGGNSLGFFGGKLSNDGNSVMGHGYQGSFHIWQKNLVNNSNEITWKPKVIVGGHFNDVRDINWESKGQYLISVSADQTTRIHAPWIRKCIESKTNENFITWHEIARPQIHGYDMQCIAILSRYKFASGAEEKIIRTFNATANFVENFRRICNIIDDPEGDKLLESLPKGASVPSLGLSNKAVYNIDAEKQTINMDKHVKDEYPENYFTPITLDAPPEEETLMQNTLWPEIQKLYGHGFEIFALCATSDGKLLASSCRATTAEHAQIIIWNTETWKQVQKLPSHQLTVTQMKFSPNNQYLLSVSRDRRWTLFENKITNDGNDKVADFQLIATTDKTNGIHSRIIWSCDWSHESKIFVTTSRDGKIVLWHKNVMPITQKTCLGEWKSLSCFELKNESVTAVAFAPFYFNSNDEYLIAAGLENGSIILLSFSNVNCTWKQIFNIDKSLAHHATVRKLQFRPIENELWLASCGEDNLVRINKITI